MAGHAAGDRIPWRPLGKEPRAERLAQRALPVGISFRVRRPVLMKGGDWRDDVRLDRVDRNRANGRDSEIRHRQFGERFHGLFPTRED